jgi:phospho-N-acetylmuramoyl-pentapeptide-transferase
MGGRAVLSVAYAAGIAFFVVLILGPSMITYLHKLKFGQSIREVGPKTHLKKAGVPTMGGILIMLAFTVAAFVATPSFEKLPFGLFVALGFGIIGLIDDFIIVVAKRSLGLRAREKLLGQILLASIFALYLLSDAEFGPVTFVPFRGNLWEMSPVLFFVFTLIVVVGSANAVNLTDGLDGLAAGTVAIAATAYAIIALKNGDLETAVFAGAIMGSCVGFTWFNSHPAQVFMGDTGSLSLGAALAVLAMFTKTPLLLVIIGGVFVLEALSVMIQVSYFRLTGGRRIFRMTPLHHHFELAGWPETKVVFRFWILGLVFGIIGLISALMG